MTLETLGKQTRSRRKEWFDPECEQVVPDRNDARNKLLYGKTRRTVEVYKTKRIRAYRVYRKKECDFEKKKFLRLEKQVTEEHKNILSDN